MSKMLVTHIREDQNESLQGIKTLTGAPVAELVRRAIDLYLQTQCQK
jgi:hypothetical protein